MVPKYMGLMFIDLEAMNIASTRNFQVLDQYIADFSTVASSLCTFASKPPRLPGYIQDPEQKKCPFLWLNICL
jgi:hypothetical protein